MATMGKIQRGPTSQNDRLIKLCLYADFHAFIAKCTILPNFALSNWTIGEAIVKRGGAGEGGRMEHREGAGEKEVH